MKKINTTIFLRTGNLFVLLFVAVACFGQNGAVVKDTLKLNDGSYYVKGSSVDIGPGSKANGGYAYIYVKSVALSMPIPLDAGWEGYKMKIVDFKLSGNNTMGKKYYLMLTVLKGKGSFYQCDPILAKEKGEIR